jgi:hypothetical protein
MSFQEFQAWIKSPALLQVAAHWNDARLSRMMPSWSDLKPARIAAHLSFVWSFRYDADSGEFLGRLVGDRIARHIGKSFQGLPLDEAYPPEARAWAKALFKRVVTEPALYGHLGIIFKQMGQPGSGERIVLPLSSDGLHADGILGATIFEPLLDAPVTLIPPSEGTERWFPLQAN